MIPRRMGAVLVALALLGAFGASAAPPVRRALVIAHNASDDPSLPALRFADDDGVLWAETLRRLGVETSCWWTRTRRRAPAAAVLAGPGRPRPRKSRAVAGLGAAAGGRRRGGRRTCCSSTWATATRMRRARLLHAAGGRLDKASLYSRLVDPLGADYIHVIVDACRASGVVGSRGPADAEASGGASRMLAREQLGARPRWAPSSPRAIRRDARVVPLRAGVFSHVARSGFMGARTSTETARWSTASWAPSSPPPSRG